ncbi:MAG: MBOAT family protein [Muribaculaceae bacterium]|nr:MBOAT family protein [Muribaculaceae bacterium]
MQFDSIVYAMFLPLVFVLYWALAKHRKCQNVLLLVASYTFYGWWDWRFLGLIFATTLTTWASGLAIERWGNRKRLWTAASVVFNLGILFTFKYFNFFVDGMRLLLASVGMEADWVTLNLVLPVGISFYTFQALSYTIDVKRGEVKATRDLVAFMVYIAFFPQLVAGPIERAKNLLPQFLRNKEWDYGVAVVGMRQILWGLTKKVVVADTLGGYLDTMLYNAGSQSASTIVMAAIIFATQIYADFSGYSDIAIGSARLLNIRLSANFKYPYFSRSWSEYWTRWHVTLMTWLRTYVYIPLGGSRCSRWRTALNVMIVFAISGLWHGANVTYVLWGISCGVLMLPHIFIGKTKPSGVATWRDLHKCLVIFALASVTFLIFRANNLTQLSDMCHALVHGSWLAVPMGISALEFIVPLAVVDWLGRRHEFPLEHLPMPTWSYQD